MKIVTQLRHLNDKRSPTVFYSSGVSTIFGLEGQVVSPLPYTVVVNLPAKPLAAAPDRFIWKEQTGAMPPALGWPHTSRLVWAHIKCFSHPPRPLKVNNPQRMRHLLRSHPIPHMWQVSVYTKPGKVCKEKGERHRGMMMMWMAQGIWMDTLYWMSIVYSPYSLSAVDGGQFIKPRDFLFGVDCCWNEFHPYYCIKVVIVLFTGK